MALRPAVSADRVPPGLNRRWSAQRPRSLTTVISQERIADVAAELAQLPTVVGVVLGGSRARGDHLPTSDVDLGVYCDGDPDAGALADLAERLTGARVPVAGPGGWGPWVNGGAWLRLDGTAVDWILRDLRRVEEQCARAGRGEFAFHAQAGHPLGFLDVSYAGELATARILADPGGRLGDLQARVLDYPVALAEAMQEALWETDLLLAAADKGLARGDVTYVVLCLSRVVLLAAHAVCARAGTWATNEKGLVALAAAQPGAPEAFRERAEAALAVGASRPAELATAVTAVRDLVADVRAAPSSGMARSPRHG